MSGDVILGIDTGIKKNGVGYCTFNGTNLFQWGNVDWKNFIKMLYCREIHFDFAVVEHFSPQRIIGYDSIENVVVLGRIMEIIEHQGKCCYRVTRREVKKFHLGKKRPSPKDDSLIRQKLKEKYPDLKIPTNDATSAFAIATYVTEQNYEPNYFIFEQKKRVKLTPEQSQHKKELYEKNQYRKATKIIEKYNITKKAIIDLRNFYLKWRCTKTKR